MGQSVALMSDDSAVVACLHKQVHHISTFVQIGSADHRMARDSRPKDVSKYIPGNLMTDFTDYKVSAKK